MHGIRPNDGALCQMGYVPKDDGTFLHRVGIRGKNAKNKGKKKCTQLGISLWKLWITLCSTGLLKILCEPVEQTGERAKEGEKSWGLLKKERLLSILGEKETGVIKR